MRVKEALDSFTFVLLISLCTRSYSAYFVYPLQASGRNTKTFLTQSLPLKGLESSEGERQTQMIISSIKHTILGGVYADINIGGVIC